MAHEKRTANLQGVTLKRNEPPLLLSPKVWQAHMHNITTTLAVESTKGGGGKVTKGGRYYVEHV